MKLIPEQMLACTDDEKRAFAAAYWLGVCVGELVNIGMPEVEIREGFERGLQSALAMRRAGTS